MPTIEVRYDDLKKLVGKKLPKKFEELWDIVQYCKTEIDGMKDGVLKLDVGDTNRPDLWCAEGIGRELRGALNIEKGVPNYSAKKSDKEVIVDKSVEKIRPFIATAIVKNIDFDKYLIKQIVQFQEKLNTTYGRNRKKSAIGIYDYDKIVFPVHYRTISPNGIKFIPLDYNKEMTPEQILEEHPKGKEFSKIFEDFKNYPLLIDAHDTVLSLPPIINSVCVGRITPSTKNVFIDVTGTHHDTVVNTLNIVTASLIDRGGRVEEVIIKYDKKNETTPDYSSTEWKIHYSNIKELLGLDLSKTEVKQLLRKARYTPKKSTKNTLRVKVPFYRTDIMHEFDIIEDIGIMYGYNNIESELIKKRTIGGLSDNTKYVDLLREQVLGIGFQEIMTYTRVDKEVLFNKDCIEIANPISNRMNMLRNELLPVCIDFLSKNTHNDYPQKIFEQGRVFIKEKKKVIEDERICLVSCHSKANFTEINQCLNWLSQCFDFNYSLKDYENNAFIKGRSATVKIGRKNAGVMGEVHPRVLKQRGIKNPIAFIELSINKMK